MFEGIYDTFYYTDIQITDIVHFLFFLPIFAGPILSMKEIRNVAIIAHVDHGKTTLVDKILIQTKMFKDYEKPGQLIMDSNELERERGITILAKNVSVKYKI